MLFKLLSDYAPRGVAVAWDTRPTHRTEIAETYKEGRRPMPDLLREQFPHFRPIVEAFGYRNLEFEGWEADDVIATIATRADEAGIKTCVVSTDRDAFQLCSENISLMMTPRGVAEVNVYTPERVELRYGVRPDQVPDFIGLKGDTSDNIPGIPGIGDKTAGQLIAQYGSLEDVIAHADELSPARGRAVKEHADQARDSKLLATMRRDLPLGVDPSELVSAPPDRSTLKEIFRRFEFRGLLSRVDTLDAALPAADVPVPAETESIPWREAAREELVLNQHDVLGVAWHDGRAGLAAGAEVLVVEGALDEVRGPLGDAAVLAHDAKLLRLGRAPADDTLIAAYLVDPGRSGYELDDLAREYGLELVPEPATEEETAALVRHAESARRLAPTLRARVREWGMERLYDEVELPLTVVLADMEDAGIRIDTYRMGEITARLAERVEELEASALDLAGEEFQLGSTQQLARILFEKLGLTAGRKGKTGYSTDARVLRADPRRPRDRAGRRGVARADEAAQHVPAAAPGADRRPRRPSPHDDQPGRRGDGAALDDEPEPPVDPRPHRARAADPLGVRRGGAGRGCCPPTTARSSSASSRTSPASPCCAKRSRAARTSTPRRRRRCSASRSARALTRPARHGEDGQLRDHLRDLVLRPLREPRHPARGGAGADRHVPRAAARSCRS